MSCTNPGREGLNIPVVDLHHIGEGVLCPPWLPQYQEQQHSLPKSSRITLGTPTAALLAAEKRQKLKPSLAPSGLRCARLSCPPARHRSHAGAAPPLRWTPRWPPPFRAGAHAHGRCPCRSRSVRPRRRPAGHGPAAALPGIRPPAQRRSPSLAARRLLWHQSTQSRRRAASAGHVQVRVPDTPACSRTSNHPYLQLNRDVKSVFMSSKNCSGTAMCAQDD